MFTPINPTQEIKLGDVKICKLKPEVTIDDIATNDVELLKQALVVSIKEVVRLRQQESKLKKYLFDIKQSITNLMDIPDLY